MNKFMILLKKDLLEILRTKKWLIYLISFCAISLLSVAIARIMPELLNMLFEETNMDGLMVYEESVADSYTQFIANMGEVAWIMIGVMFANSLSKEKSKGTYQMLKSNGISETKIVLSHFLSKLILITFSYLASVLVFFVSNLIVFKEYVGFRGAISLFYIYLLLVFALCFAMFASSVAKKSGKAIVLVIVTYFILYLLMPIPYIDIYNPMYSMNLASNLIIYDAYELKDYLINLFITLGLSIGLIIGSVFLYKNRIDNRK